MLFIGRLCRAAAGFAPQRIGCRALASGRGEDGHDVARAQLGVDLRSEGNRSAPYRDGERSVRPRHVAHLDSMSVYDENQPCVYNVTAAAAVFLEQTLRRGISVPGRTGETLAKIARWRDYLR